MTREERKEQADMRDEYHRMEERLTALEEERDKLRFGLAGLLLCVDASEGVKDHVRRALQEAEG